MASFPVLNARRKQSKKRRPRSTFITTSEPDAAPVSPELVATTDNDGDVIEDERRTSLSEPPLPSPTPLPPSPAPHRAPSPPRQPPPPTSPSLPPPKSLAPSSSPSRLQPPPPPPPRPPPAPPPPRKSPKQLYTVLPSNPILLQPHNQFQPSASRRTRLPDPFSTEWRGALAAEDQPSFLIDSEDDELQPRAQLKVDRFRTTDKDTQLNGLNDSHHVRVRGDDCAPHNDDDDDDEGTWQNVLLQRAGVQRASDAGSDSEDRELEQRTMRERLAACLDHDNYEHNEDDDNPDINTLINAVREEVSSDSQHARTEIIVHREKIERMEQSATDARRQLQGLVDAAAHDADAERFYERLDKDVRALTCALRRHKRRHRQRRRRPQQRPISKKVDVDEYGRVRRRSEMAMQITQISDSDNESVEERGESESEEEEEEVDESMTSIQGIAGRFDEWKIKYPFDFEQFKGNTTGDRLIDVVQQLRWRGNNNNNNNSPDT